MFGLGKANAFISILVTFLSAQIMIRRVRVQAIEMIQHKQLQKRQVHEEGSQCTNPMNWNCPARMYTTPIYESALSPLRPSYSHSQPHLGSSPQQQQQTQPHKPAPSAHPFVPPMRANLNTSAESVNDPVELPARKRHKASASRSVDVMGAAGVAETEESCESEISGVIDLMGPYNEGRKIVVKCKYHLEGDIFVIMNPLTPMSELMVAVARRVKRPLHMLHFLVDGVRMTSSFTWESCRMENGAEVDVMLSSTYR